MITKYMLTWRDIQTIKECRDIEPEIVSDDSDEEYKQHADDEVQRQLEEEDLDEQT